MKTFTYWHLIIFLALLPFTLGLLFELYKLLQEKTPIGILGLLVLWLTIFTLSAITFLTVFAFDVPLVYFGVSFIASLMVASILVAIKGIAIKLFFFLR